MINRGIAFEPLLGGQGTQFDALRINYIGSPGRDTTVCAARKDAALQSLQDPKGGLFEEPTHHPMHTTAHCIAALELFDARPLHPLAALAEWKSPTGARAFLESLAWRTNPWRESHRGAGLFAALAIVEEVDAAWQDAYFDWLYQHSDPRTGLIGGNDLPPVEHSGVATLVPHMAGTFHYFFNIEWARRELRYPQALIARASAAKFL